ncbi:uncharacterized protein LOC124202391 [Daphnia pulex]|uniref:uncharacterized protein LOC124202391 n=1 Tax=Daphnia pulex TaxID=6669 RepID=UPI001EE06CBD|nr:uncharacterized protein LOC124202391 [Daphnia pulex]
MAHNRQMRPSSANFVTQEQLKQNVLNLEETVKQGNQIVVEGLVMLQRKVNTINSQVEKRLGHVEDQVKHFNERTSSLYLQFMREHAGQEAIIHNEQSASPILHSQQQQPVVHNQVTEGYTTIVDTCGLIPLTEGQINRMAHNSTCVEFIERLVLAAFPDHYFEDHGFADITNLQFIGLFQIIGRYFETAILLSGKRLKLSLPCNYESKIEVATIMENEINLWKRDNGYSRSEEPVIPNAQQQDRSGIDREVRVIQLSERELDALAFRADSVAFIGKVTIAAFPANYFLKTENTPMSLSPRQLDAIYEMVIKKISEVKRRGKPSVPISKEAVFPVIYQKIRNFRLATRHVGL